MSVVKRVSAVEKPSPPPLPRRVLYWSAMVVLLFLFLCSVVISFRVFHARHGLALIAAHIIPYPAAVVDHQIIWYGSVVRLTQAVEPTVSEDTDPFQAALALLVRRAVIASYADEWHITLSAEDREAAKASGLIASPVSSWSESAYERDVLDPLLLAQKVEEALKEDSRAQEVARSRLAKVQFDLESGMDFEGLARYRSEDPAASAGGDLGFLSREMIPPGLESAFVLPVGSVSDILEQPDFFTIAKVVDERLDEEGNRTDVALRVISVHKATLSQVVDAYLEAHPPKYFVDE